MEKKKTLIIGASTNPGRYAYKAAHHLVRAGHPIVNIGLDTGEVAGEVIQSPGGEPLTDVHTVTLYLRPQNQKEYYDYISHTHPKRIIFNPGTENEELIALAERLGIEPVIGCTLVMLSTGEF